MRNVPSRLIKWLIITVLLVCILIIGVYGFSPSAFSGVASAGSSISFHYDGADTYSNGGGEVLLDGITGLDINWVSGGIEILPYEGTQVKIYETAARALEDHEILRYRVQDGMLSVQYCESRIGFTFRNMPAKRLTILLPSTIALESIAIESATGELILDGGGLSAGTIDIESVTGDITIRNWIAGTLSIESASGALDIHGEFDRINTECVSGDQTYHLPTTPDTIEIEAVASGVVLLLTKDRGFSASLESLTGSITTDFAQTQGRKNAAYGDADAFMMFETVTGDVALCYAEGLSRVSPAIPAKKDTAVQAATPTPSPSPQPRNTAPVPSSERNF